MKKEYCLERLAVVFIIVVCAAIQAEEVSENDILTAARKWIADNAVFKLELPNAVPEKAVQMTKNDGQLMPLWRVDLQPTGYLIMSSDDSLPPVVTFNTNGSFELPEGHPLPSMLKRQGEIFQEELDKPQTRGNELATENQTRWNKLLKRTRADSITPSAIITAPMLTTKWNQNTPYNYFCPSGENYEVRAITGCTATAFAQLLKYHEWPPVGQGISTHQDNTQPFIGSFMADYSFPYEWNLMRDNHKDTWSATYPRTTISRNDWAVSRLMMEMAVFATANFNETSTSAPDARFKNLITEKLKYAGTAEYGWTYYVDQQIIYQRILTDMLAGRPALVAGSRYDENGEELGGHAFVADGLGTMDGLEYCHFNYGWSGSWDGWYLLTAGYRNYIVEEATTGIMPKSVPVIKMMSVEQAASFTLSWDFPKRITAEAFRLTKTSGSTSTVISSSIAGTVRSYNLTGQSGTATYTLEAKVDGIWQMPSNSVTVTVKTNPTPMLSLMVDDEMNSVAGRPFTTTVVANNPLQSLTVSCSRPDMVPDSSITIAGSGISRTISFTPASEFVGNAILYLTGTDTAGNVVKQTVLLRVLENSFTWNSTFNDVQNRALLTGRLILMISGLDGDSNTSFFRNTVCEDAAIKANLLANYELWYDSSLTGRSAYASDLGSAQPFIAIIDPSGNGTRLRGHGGHMSVDEAEVFLDTTLPNFSLTDTTLTAGTTQSLELSVLDPNAEIRYRLDSSAPTISDMIYSEAIQLSAATTISARAFKYGIPVSNTVTKTYTFLPQVAKPVLNADEQQAFTGSFTVTATCATTGATLRYTTDGTKPIGSSPVFPSTGLVISDDVQLMVCAFKDGMKESEIVVSQFFSIDSLLEGEGIELVGDETTWFLQAETYNSAPSAMQSQAIDDNGSTTMTAMVTGNGELSFYWKVSSEAGYDMLAFAIDGVKKAEISGTKEWEQKTFTVTGGGEHKLVWTYSKDRSVFSGSDCGWVDDIVWLSDRTLVSISISGPSSIATASTATYTCTATWSDGTTTTVMPTWNLSSTTNASVNTGGVVTNKNTTTIDQTVTLIASYTANGVTKTASKTITLEKKKPVSFSITRTGGILLPGGSVTFSAMVTWSDGTTSEVPVLWSLSSTMYASLSPTYGTSTTLTNKNTTTTDQTVTLTASYTANGVTNMTSMTITLKASGQTDDTQILALEAGWNWVGFNVLPESHKVGDVLGTSGFTANDIIQMNGGMSRFTGESWMPGSFTVEYGKLYQIYVANDMTLEISGMACDSFAMPLVSGWNWIGSPTKETVSPAQLVHSGGWTAGDRIQTSGGASVTYTGGKWIPASFTLEPGKGYQIYAANEGILSFPSADEDDALYAVVDLSGGPDATSYPVRYTNTAPNLDDDTCRTTELWLRRIPAGTFVMGSPEDEVGRSDDETQHEVTLTQDFYIGVFECTQKQWELVMGSTPSNYKGDCRPVECVSYNRIRGAGGESGVGWPTYGHAVDSTSFMGKLLSRTGLTFDLPTEAQWEYACRAGTPTALNSGKNLTSTGGRQDTAMDEVGRYAYNEEDGKGGYSQNHTTVGSYLPNVWGLYDMHGNVYELCLDWYNGNDYDTVAVEDPIGPTTGSFHVVRGGDFATAARACRSAHRISNKISSGERIGFRVLCLP